MVMVCESLLLNVKNYFKQDKRTNGEIKAMLFEMFEYNNREFVKVAKLYDGTRNVSIFDRVDYEIEQVEKLKKRKFGDNRCKN